MLYFTREMSHCNRKHKTARPLLLWGVVLVLCAGFLGFFISEKICSPQENKTLVPIGGDFSLFDTKGRHVSSKNFKGRYLLIYFGYSFCPDICPTALENMTEAMVLLGPYRKYVQPIFITIDPKRDTQKALREYMTSFHPSFVALTGDRASVDRAIKGYRVYANPTQEGENVLIDHSSIVYFMGPNGEFLGHFNHETPGAEMASFMKKVLNR